MDLSIAKEIFIASMTSRLLGNGFMSPKIESIKSFNNAPFGVPG